MLEPEDRRLLTDALRPPRGLELSFGVGTTFTLDLLALLVTPLTFALLDWQEGDGSDDAEPLALLEAARRYAERIAVFCDAGFISVPRSDQALFQYLEGSVFGCVPPSGGLFHPKMWLLRFAEPDDADDAPVYRLICSSRNLTFDKSWDAFVVLEAEVPPTRMTTTGQGRRLESFLRGLPGMSRGVPDAVGVEIDRMAADVARIDWSKALPDRFERIRFWPLGADQERWPFGGGVDRMLVMSPFLGPGMLGRLTDRGRRHVLISRQESLDAIPTATLDHGFDKVLVFDDTGAIAAAGPDAPDEQSSSLAYLSGLHAKAYVAEFGQEASVWLGSLNATEGAIDRNVEFLVELIGPKRLFGIEALLREDPKTADFADLLQPYQPPAQPLEPDPEEDGNRSLVEQARRSLAGTAFQLEARVDRDAWSLNLMTPSTIKLKAGATVSCWPIRMTEAAGGRRIGHGDRGEIASWKAEVDSLTSFIAFQVSAGEGAKQVVERFVLNLPLEGGPTDRNEQLLRNMLRTPERLLRFLLFLLADGDTASSAELIAGMSDQTSQRDAPAAYSVGLPLFEAMMRAFARSPNKLDHVHRLVTDLTADNDDLLPDGFHEVWDPIWEARQAGRST